MTKVKITTRLLTQTENGAEHIDNAFAGEMAKREDFCELNYAEGEGVKTHCVISSDRVVLKRAGALQSVMEFVNGATTVSHYKIPEGIIEMEIRTTQLEIVQTQLHGEVLVDYEIIMSGMTVAQNQLLIAWSE